MTDLPGDASAELVSLRSQVDWLTRQNRELQSVHQSFRDSEERARMAFAAARMGAFDWQAGDEKSSYFGDMMSLFGRAADDEHKSYADFLQSIHPDDRALVDETVRRALKGGCDYEVEFRAVWPDGTLHWIAEKGTVHRDAAGKPMRMLGIALDIDERKHAEEERARLDARVQQTQKLETLGTLAGGVAHDFNNLLQAILGNAGLIREQAPPSPMIENCLDQIDMAVQRASELTRRLLAYAGKGKFVAEPIDLSAVALEMSKLLEASIPKRARILGQFPPGLPAIAGDPTQVRQVIMNLVINAAESLSEGSGVMRLATGIVSLATQELAGLSLGDGRAAGNYVYFEVCDTGCGMTDEIKAKIFDPFFSTKDKGRGLGLAAVLGIMGAHQGALQVHSEPGAGSVFRVLFPASDKPLSPGLAPRFGEIPGYRTLGMILVVDDEPSIRNSAKLLLETMGYKVVTAGDGLEALQVFGDRQSEISAVLLDLTMPHMSGSEAFRELRALRPDLPILVTSGYSEEESVRDFHDSDLAGFIQKPYRASQLRARLREVLEREAHRAAD
jgi:signal transduction histidine kinase/CheY-like chemotaxis protein